MADVSKLRRKGSLGAPPPPDDVATSLNAPEIAPVVTESLTAAEPVQPYVRRDGRSARKTNRTLALATRVTPDFDREIRDIAEREGILIVEVLERALEAYKEKKSY